MNSDQNIEQLKHEIAYLRVEISSLTDTLKTESDSTTKHINQIYQRIKDTRVECGHDVSTLFDMVEPLEEELFPKVSEARRQLREIIDKRRRAAEKPKSQKKK